MHLHTLAKRGGPKTVSCFTDKSTIQKLTVVSRCVTDSRSTTSRVRTQTLTVVSSFPLVMGL